MSDEMMRLFVAMWILGVPIALVLLLCRISLWSRENGGLKGPPNAAFWTVFVLCLPLGLILATVRFVAIPVGKACARDWKGILSIEG